MASTTEDDGRGHHAVNLGHPGASARAEYERRRDADDRRRRALFGRHLAPVVKALVGERPSTTAWDRGRRGEEQVGGALSRAVDQQGVVLHDRAIPGRRSNIDHLAVVPSGVWVIDTKLYRGRVQRRDLGGWFISRPALFVNGHNRTGLLAGAQRQLGLVHAALGDGVPIHAALCFADAEFGLLARPFSLDGVLVTWTRKLAASLVTAGPLDGPAIGTLAAQLSAAFPPYAPSGTSHKPTGAPPSG